MIIKSLKARILRALKSSLPAGAGATDSSPPSPTKPGAVRVAHAADALSDDASFFDAREADDDETPTKKAHHPPQQHGAAEEPLDAWELVDAAAADGRTPDPAEPEPDPEDSLLLLQSFPARCPPGGQSIAVLYTTTLRGVRRTFEDCNAVRALLENLGAAFQERDVSMDRGLRQWRI